MQALLAKVVNLRDTGCTESTNALQIEKKPTASAQNLVASVLVPQLGSIRLARLLITVSALTLKKPGARASYETQSMFYTYKLDRDSLRVEEVGTWDPS